MRQCCLNHFRSGRVPDRKYISGCKCASCAPIAHKECAQQTAKNCRKAPKGFFDSLGTGVTPGSQLSLFPAGGSRSGTGRVRAETFAEQIQLQLNCQLQSGNGCQHTLCAGVDLNQIIHVNATQLGSLFDFFMLRFQNTCQCLLLFGNCVNQPGNGLAAAVIGSLRCSLNGFHRMIILSI